MFKCSAVRCFFAVVLLSLTASSISAAQAATIAPSATTAPGSVTEDVRRNIQELLKADAAAMAADPASTHVLVPKLPAFLPAQIKRPAPATRAGPGRRQTSTGYTTGRRSGTGKAPPYQAGQPRGGGGRVLQGGPAGRGRDPLRAGPGGRPEPPTRIGALLQLGVCKEQTDPQAAVAVYRPAAGGMRYFALAAGRHGPAELTAMADRPGRAQPPEKRR